ncbi:MAG: EF-P lysine aminoacylase EpmA [Oleibacter sp.]|nr:EF-P lysine aminoacylase EpmA [Thalassolituus sp.]
MPFQDWQPSCNRAALVARSVLYRDIRAFFHDRQVLEVDTPILGCAPVNDPNIEPMATRESRWLHTSPEYAMKRLLCADSGDIWQLCKVFRAGEAGRRHNPEFTMLEWYRLGFSLSELMSEVAQLVSTVFAQRWPSLPVVHLTYAEALQNYANLDLATASDNDIQVLGCGLAGGNLELSRDGWLDIIMSHAVEPALPANTLVFVRDFPASQAALAQIAISPNGQAVAQRFELFFNGTELANGYFELTDADQQRQRFQQASALARESRPLDERVLAALEHGLPSCAGVALGVDRLLMHQLGVNAISEVLSFDWSRA